MKTKKETNTIKQRAETASRKFTELNDDELEQVTGGIASKQLGSNTTTGGAPMPGVPDGI